MKPILLWPGLIVLLLGIGVLIVSLGLFDVGFALPADVGGFPMAGVGGSVAVVGAIMTIAGFKMY